MTSIKHLKPQTSKSDYWNHQNTQKTWKWHEKLQGSRYDKNDEIAVTLNNEKLKLHLKSLSDWPSKSQCIVCILKNQQNPMSKGKKSILKTHLKSLLHKPTNFLTILKHLKPQTTKWTMKSTKSLKKPENGMKNYKDHSISKMHKTQQL